MGQTFDPSRTFCQPTAAQMWNTQNYRTSHLTPINSSQSQFIPFAPGCSGYNSQLYGQFQMAAPLQQQHQTSQNQVQCLPSDMSIGSLPNMHASSQPHPGKIIMPTTFENVPSCYPTSASVSASDNNEVVVQQQLSTPSLYNQSQSAPTSPAQIKDIPSPLRQQWMTNRHYSVSPEILDVPNICVTGTDGNESLDCFQVSVTY
jgi:hypothetical protein